MSLARAAQIRVGDVIGLLLDLDLGTLALYRDGDRIGPLVPEKSLAGPLVRTGLRQMVSKLPELSQLTGGVALMQFCTLRRTDAVLGSRSRHQAGCCGCSAS
eukprot:SAG11_NODE_12693_length_690_cov_1.174281_1_plen_102_part_00